MLELQTYTQMQDPDAYLPERFMPNTPEAAAVPEHGWVPFGEGTRACIGLRCAPCWPSSAVPLAQMLWRG